MMYQICARLGQCHSTNSQVVLPASLNPSSLCIYTLYHKLEIMSSDLA